MINVLTMPRQWLAQNTSTLQRLILIMGVLLLSLAIPFKASQRQMQLLIAVLPAVGVVLIFLRSPSFGLVTLIANSLLSPSPNLPGGLNLAVLHLGLLLGLWLLTIIVNRGKIKSIRSLTVRPILFFVGIAILAFANGQINWFPFTQRAPMDAQIGGLAIFVLAAGAFLLVGTQIKDIRWLEAMTWLFVVLSGVYVLGWLVPGLGPITNRFYQTPVTSNSMFWTWLVALAFSQALFNRRLHMGWRAVLIGLVLATLYVAYFLNSGWKSGYLPPLVSIAVIVGIRNPRAGILLGLISIVPAQFLGSEAVATDQYSYGTRVEAWLIVLDMVRVNPVLGFGPANYYFYTPLWNFRGYYIRFNSHSQYVDIVAQIGLLGMAAFIWFVWAISLTGWKLRTRVPEGFAYAYVYGVLGGLAGTLAAGILVDWFLPFVYNIGLNGFRGGMLPWLFLGGLVSLEQIVRSQTRPL